jgi:hypothetical protein
MRPSLIQKFLSQSTNLTIDMRKKDLTDIWVVHEDEIFRFETDFTDSANLIFRSPLNQFLDDESLSGANGRHRRRRHKHLLVVPDHWMGNQLFAFQSNKSSLIEPFLERKLSSAHPEKRNIVHFFDYQLPMNRRNGGQLYAYFLQEEKGFALYDKLSMHHHTPRRIISPSFLWEYWLRRQPNLKEDSFCLLHFFGQECALYFFDRGNFLFSRHVLLDTGTDCWAVLTYEINQSLYLYAQKTKSDLKCIYWYAAEHLAEPPAIELPDRRLIQLDLTLAPTMFSDQIRQLSFLDGMLSERLNHLKTNILSLTHRRVKKFLEWLPVRRIGMVLGGVLVALMLAEHVWLGNLAEKDQFKRRHIAGTAGPNSMGDSAEYSQALDVLLTEAVRPAPAELILKLAAELPPSTRIRSLEIQHANSPQLKISASVDALDVNHFKVTLNELVGKVNNAFQTSQPLMLKDIDFKMQPADSAHAYQRYLINFRIHLS